MTETDEAFIAQRRTDERRNFLINGLDHTRAPRLGPALSAIRGALDGRDWVAHAAVIASGLRASDVVSKTVDQQLRNAVAAGMVERRGAYNRTYNRRTARWKVDDTREYRLIDWPLPS